MKAREQKPDSFRMPPNYSEASNSRRRSAVLRCSSSIARFSGVCGDLHARKGLSIAKTPHALGVTKAAIYMARSRVSRLLSPEV